MKDITFDYVKCGDLIEEFGRDKIITRGETLYEEMTKFIADSGLLDVAVVNKFLLSDALIDYFQDIKRLKDFHRINKVNSQKIIAYTAYWLLHRKPIQICGGEEKQGKELTTLNERFVLQYILDYLSVRIRKTHILERENKGLNSFANCLLYYLVYRSHDRQSLEMIITAFLAGQIYERIDEDISNELHPFDHKR
ncbi:MAG: hypothetical protein LBK75_02150 [Oscillospiraceae bacterium]|nr:hypothetical protein [Oscillospiraceae bacterium]